MTQSVPSAIKAYGRFLNQAKHLDKTNPIVAYYCRLHTIDQIISSGCASDKDVKVFLSELMSKLERDSQELGGSLNKEDGKAACEQLALSVFTNADEADRGGRVDSQVAMAFYAAFVLMEVSSHFGELTPDLCEKKKYAQWKAADISKALKEGRTPQSGSPNQNINEAQPVESSASASAPVPFVPSQTPPVSAPISAPVPSAPSVLAKPSAPQSVPTPGSKPTASASAFHYAPTSASGLGSGLDDLEYHERKLARCMEADKLLRHAISALNFQDVNTSLEKIQLATILLSPFSKP